MQTGPEIWIDERALMLLTAKERGELAAAAASYGLEMERDDARRRVIFRRPEPEPEVTKETQYQRNARELGGR